MSAYSISKRKNGSAFGNVAANAVIACFCLFCIIPLVLVISISFSDDIELTKDGYKLIPAKISLAAYEYIFKYPEQLLNSYMVTIIVTAAGTVLSLFLTALLAYVISRKDYRYKNITTFYIFFTTLFNGGLVPWYILITKYLHLNDKIFVLFVPYMVNAFFVLLMKGFMSNLPATIFESAKIDGASEYRIFFRIVAPLSKPGLATIGLFYALLFWNDWILPLLFTNNNNLVSLQYMLYKIMSSIDFISMMTMSNANVSVDISKIPNNSARMAMVMLAAGPMLFAFPFFQKYFVRGLTIGSLKG